MFFASINKLFGKNFVRRCLLKKAASSVMSSFYAEPFPSRNRLISETDIVSVDIETTGLNPENDKIVSIGFVTVKNLSVQLEMSGHYIVHTKKCIPEQSVVIHQITDDRLKEGISIRQAVPLLLQHLQGKVMLVHNANIEQGFLNKICRSLYGSDFVIPVIDTQLLAKRSMERRNLPCKSTDLRLFNLRRKYNMPAYKAHNALMDAIATAELFLAMVAEFSPENKARLKNFTS